MDPRGTSFGSLNRILEPLKDSLSFWNPSEGPRELFREPNEVPRGAHRTFKKVLLRTFEGSPYRTTLGTFFFLRV